MAFTYYFSYLMLKVEQAEKRGQIARYSLTFYHATYVGPIFYSNQLIFLNPHFTRKMDFWSMLQNF